MRGSIVLFTVLGLMTSAGLAEAGPWYYTWSCTGECAPGQLVIDGREGPFATREDCDYARDRDPRAYEFVRPGNLGGLGFCEEVRSTAYGGEVAPGGAPPAKVRIVAVEMGLGLGAGWSATGADGMSSSGSATAGIEIDSHTGREIGGGSVQLGLYGTRLDSPSLGSVRTAMVLPLSVGLVLSPAVYHRGDRSVRLDLGASVGGAFLFGCSDCNMAVFDETLSFGYTLKAGLDLFVSKTTGYGLDVVFPRWQFGTASSGNLLLESPTWMIRLSVINRPAT